MSLYKSLSHRRNFCESKLYTDVSKMWKQTPGPYIAYIEPSKTIKAPFSKGDKKIFGQHAGQQCCKMNYLQYLYSL